MPDRMVQWRREDRRHHVIEWNACWSAPSLPKSFAKEELLAAVTLLNKRAFSKVAEFLLASKATTLEPAAMAELLEFEFCFDELCTDV